MSTVLVAVILVGIPAILITLLIMNESRKKRNHMKQFLNRFTELGSLHNLNFSSHELLKDAAIGLDGVQRKLLVLKGSNENSFSNHLLDLRDVKACSVKRQYGTIGAGGIKANQLENYLQHVALHFEFRNDTTPLDVIFYNHSNCDVYEISELSEKAKHWEVMLSKLLKSPIAPVSAMNQRPAS